MVRKIIFQNNIVDNLEILIEPEAEFLYLAKNEKIIIEIEDFTDEYNDGLEIVLEKDLLIIYETRQSNMKIFINEELKYYTTPNKLRI